MTQPSLQPGVSLRDSIARAVAALKSDGLAIIPTETVYGVAARAASAPALARLAALRVKPLTRPATWHAPDRQAVLAVLPLTSPLHRRVVEKLLPGPVRLLVELPGPALARVLGALGVPAGVIDHDGVVGIRVPDNAVASDVLTRVGSPVIAERLANFDLGDGDRLPERFTTDLAGTGVDAAVNDGPTRYAGASTTVRLTADGGWSIGPTGALPEPQVRAKVERTVLFVCTGNTCRSPMAEALARAELASRTGPGRVPIRVESAGVSASSGDPMTREAVQALRALGVNAKAHHSRPLTREMAQHAEVVYTMTQAHARAARAMLGPAVPIVVLDPSGADVPDPIGAGADVYDSTARRLRELIRARLDALDRAPDPTTPPRGQP